MVTTRAQALGPNGPGLHNLKSDLQRRRDKRGFRIRKKYNTNWLPNPLPNRVPRRVNHHPRGINNPTGTRSYQNVVHQALLHTPIWTKWILEHDNTTVPHNAANCVRCSYKALVELYWGAVPPNVVLQQAWISLAQIANAAAAHPSGLFTPGADGDASEFYDWAILQMRERTPHGLPCPDPVWNEEFDALYRIDYKTTFTCPVCHTTVTHNAATSPDLAIGVEFDPSAHASLAGILDDFFSSAAVFNCTNANCGYNGEHDRRREIEAAPQVLRVYVRIFGHQYDMPVKLCQDFDIPEQLDWTQRQVNSQLPLTYSLSSAISHGGGRHHVERGLPGSYEDEYRFFPPQDDTESESSQDDSMSDDDDDDDLMDGDLFADEDLSDDEEFDREEFDRAIDRILHGSDEDDSETAGDRQDSPMMQDENRIDDASEDDGDDLQSVQGAKASIKQVFAKVAVHTDMSSQVPSVGAYQTHVAKIRFQKSPGGTRPRYSASHFNGLKEVTDEEYIHDLGPGSSDISDDDALNRIYETSPSPEADSAANLASAVDINNPATIQNIIAGVNVVVVPPQLPQPNNGTGNFALNPGQLFEDGGDDEPLWAVTAYPTNTTVDHTSHYILNARGKQHSFHISDDHCRQIPDVDLRENPQMPTDACARPNDYQVYVLTYTRDALSGSAKKQEDNIPPFI